jgi:hypothetical protein
MTILEIAVFKMPIGNALRVSGQVSLALVGDDDLEGAPACFKLPMSPDSRVCFLPTSKRSHAPARSRWLTDATMTWIGCLDA